MLSHEGLEIYNLFCFDLGCIICGLKLLVLWGCDMNTVYTHFTKTTLFPHGSEKAGKIST